MKHWTTVQDTTGRLSTGQLDKTYRSCPSSSPFKPQWREGDMRTELDIKGDLTLTCAKCGAQFTWSAGAQIWFHQRGFHQPKRCAPCRDARKQWLESAS